jgi:hypothetical protein
MAYNCDSDDGNGAAVIVTLLGEGETLAWCGNCLPVWIDQMHAMFHADDPAKPVADTPEYVAAQETYDALEVDELTPADETTETEQAAAES